MDPSQFTQLLGILLTAMTANQPQAPQVAQAPQVLPAATFTPPSQRSTLSIDLTGNSPGAGSSEAGIDVFRQEVNSRLLPASGPAASGVGGGQAFPPSFSNRAGGAVRPAARRQRTGTTASTASSFKSPVNAVSESSSPLTKKAKRYPIFNSYDCRKS